MTYIRFLETNNRDQRGKETGNGRESIKLMGITPFPISFTLTERNPFSIAKKKNGKEKQEHSREKKKHDGRIILLLKYNTKDH